MKSLINLYKEAYGGLSGPSWMLALVILINRSGSMVLPFLSVYLTTALGYEVKEAGYILSVYGVGALCGGLLGGKLTDSFGHFYIQFLSLLVSGVGFICIAFIDGYYALMLAVFLVSMIAESLRPANASSIAHYAKPGNLTRSFSLNRMAVNLGFSIGPALGGILAAVSYKYLFLGDGLTCILAGLVFYFYFRNKEGNRSLTKRKTDPSHQVKSPYRDLLYLAFVVGTCLYATMFFQLFMTLPLYYADVYTLGERQIGGLIALNGLIVFAVEMVLVYKIGTRYKLAKLISIGTICLTISFSLLALFSGWHILVISMIILSLSEILAMPYMATLAVERSVEANRGSYMGLYTVAYSTAFILAPLLGTSVIDRFGYDVLWWILSGLAIVCSIALYIVVSKMGIVYQKA